MVRVVRTAEEEVSMEGEEPKRIEHKQIETNLEEAEAKNTGQDETQVQFEGMKDQREDLRNQLGDPSSRKSRKTKTSGENIW